MNLLKILLVITVILSPFLVLAFTIIFSGKPKE
jgi:hypothetical protein